MTARFNGVTWFGDQGSFNFMNYHRNAFNAFKTAEALKILVNTTCCTSTSTIIAHSLGNMVVCSAIKDHGMTVGKYHMLNSAVPSEAFDYASVANNNIIINTNITYDSQLKLMNPEWEGYNIKTWCTDWHLLFLNDHRNKLTWWSRFKQLGTNVINYYSGNDEVLKLNKDNNVGIGTFKGGDFWGNYSWHKQEIYKGRGYHDSLVGFIGTDWCGWGFEMKEGYFNGETIMVKKYTPAQANALSDDDLRVAPVFHLYPLGINSPIISDELKNEILAKGIPALSPACGAGIVKGVTSNEDLEANVSSTWSSREQEWRHSDVKNKAFFFTYYLYLKLLQ